MQASESGATMSQPACCSSARQYHSCSGREGKSLRLFGPVEATCRLSVLNLTQERSSPVQEARPQASVEFRAVELANSQSSLALVWNTHFSLRFRLHTTRVFLCRRILDVRIRCMHRWYSLRWPPFCLYRNLTYPMLQHTWATLSSPWTHR